MKVVFTVLKVLITSEPIVWSLAISITCRGEATQQVAKGVALFQLNVSVYWGSRTLVSKFLA